MNAKDRQRQRRNKRKKANRVEPLPILTYDDLVAAPCRLALLGDLGIIPAMLATLTNAADGIGLAAPQVGHDVHIIVIWAGRAAGRPPMVMINPAIYARSEEKSTAIEGCLSYPGLQAEVQRHNAVWVRYWYEGKERKVALDGLDARVLQHEMDHLDGVCEVREGTTEQKSLKETVMPCVNFLAS